MKIRKGSWHHKLYMLGSQMSDDKGKIDHTNLCSYVRRATLSAAFVAFVVYPIALVIFFFVAILGFGLVELRSGKADFLRFPFLVRWNGEKKSLAWFVIPSWLLIGLGALILRSLHVNPIGTIGFFEGITVGILALAIIVMVILTVIAIARSTSRIKKKHFFSQSGRITEAVHLAKEYLKAKKEGICPLVEFVDEPEQPESEPQPQS